MLYLIIVALAVCVMISLAIGAWSKTTRWVSFTLIPFVAVLSFLGWQAGTDLLGRPTNVLPDSEWILIGGMVSPPEGIYLTVLPVNGKTPILVRYPFSEKQAKMLSQALSAMCQGKTVMGNSKKKGKEGEGNKGDGDSKEDSEFIMYEFDVQSRAPKS